MKQYGNKCPIWGTPATIFPPGEEAVIVESPRTGGRYRLVMTYAIGVQRVPELARARLTTWLVDQRRMGEEMPYITHDVVMAAVRAANLRTTAKMDRFFLALAAASFDPAGTFKIAGSVDEEQEKWRDHLGAWTEDPRPEGGLEVRRFLEDRKWIEQQASGVYRLTAEGVDQFERITAGQVTFNQGFVAMWFGEEMNAVYSDGFALGISDAGYKPMRIDQKEHNNKIDDEIIAEIRRSRFVVVDMTCPVIDLSGKLTALARGGVYYEAGFAFGLGIPVIWTARQGMADHLHFDIRQYAHILWSDPADLRSKLKVRIGAVLGYGPQTK